MNEAAAEVVEETTDTQETTQEKQEEVTTTFTEKETQEKVEEKQEAEDWRVRAAGEDEKLQKLANRYNSEGEMLKALNEAQTKIRSGLAKTLPDEPTEEELKAYREENGIPEKVEDYKLELEEGLVIGDADKPIVDVYLEAMHQANATPSQINAGVNAYFKQQEAQIVAQEEQDNTDMHSMKQELREEWGDDNYRANKNAVTALLNQIPESVRDAFMNARLGDGTAVLNNPSMVMYLADLSRKTNPTATVVPNVDDPVSAINDELSEIQALIEKNDPKYWKSEKMRKRYGELLAAKENIK